MTKGDFNYIEKVSKKRSLLLSIYFDLGPYKMSVLIYQSMLEFKKPLQRHFQGLQSEKE